MSPEAIDALVAMGVTAEQLAAAVKAEIVAAERIKQEKRAKDAERQRKSRASRNVTVTACDSTDVTDEPAPLSPFPPHPPITPYPTPQTKGDARGTFLPANWRPDADGWDFAVRTLGLRKAEQELATFRDFWAGKSGKDGRKRDWLATWRNWVRRAGERVPKGQGPPRPARADYGQIALVHEAKVRSFLDDNHCEDPQVEIIPPGRRLA